MNAMSLDSIGDGSSSSDENSSDSRAPDLGNNGTGVAAWVNSNDDHVWLSVSLPLGLGNVNLFPENEAAETALRHLSQEADQ